MTRSSLSRWNGDFAPSFMDLVPLGVITNSHLLSYGATVTGLASTDGEVAFNESILAYPEALSADTVYLVSSSASDTNDYHVEGLNADDELTTMTVTATGTTPVALSGTWNHIQRCVATDTANVGTVYTSTDSGAVPTTVSDQIQTVMLAGVSYAINPLLVCPVGRTILIKRFTFSIDTRDVAIVRIFANREGNYIQNFVIYGSDSRFDQGFDAALKLRPLDRFRVSIELTSSTGTNAAFGMNGVVLTGSISE